VLEQEQSFIRSDPTVIINLFYDGFYISIDAREGCHSAYFFSQRHFQYIFAKVREASA
jgi:hypothetical protein